MKRVLAALIVVASLTGCSAFNDARGLGDAPVGKVHETKREVWVNIDGYPNISFFCIGPNGVYTHTRVAAPIVIKDDGNCKVPG